MSLLRKLVSIRDEEYRKRLMVSQQSRYRDKLHSSKEEELGLVETVFQLDQQSLNLLKAREIIQYNINLCSKTISERFKKRGQKQDEISQKQVTSLEWGKRFTQEELESISTEELRQLSRQLSMENKRRVEQQKELEERLKHLVKFIGNIILSSCPISKDEQDNVVVRQFGEAVRHSNSKYNGHYQVMKKLGLEMTERVSKPFGNRSYFLTGHLLRLKQALVQYALDFIANRGYLQVEVPVLINKEEMADIAQLTEFDEELYRVEDGDQSRYLIATSEQAMVAYHRDQTLDLKRFPYRYGSISNCFRREAGHVGSDMTGIFRVHQFEKIEQFTVTLPEKSEEMIEEMICNAEEFYQSLGIPYRVVNIVSGELNLAAALKYDLEGWFPVSGTYRELVSCSNCTDYQSRSVNCRYRDHEGNFSYPHMLNSTLCAVTRTLCVICETYQTDTGIEVPEVLRPYLGGREELVYNL